MAKKPRPWNVPRYQCRTWQPLLQFKNAKRDTFLENILLTNDLIRFLRWNLWAQHNDLMCAHSELYGRRKFTNRIKDTKEKQWNDQSYNHISPSTLVISKGVHGTAISMVIHRHPSRAILRCPTRAISLYQGNGLPIIAILNVAVTYLDLDSKKIVRHPVEV